MTLPDPSWRVKTRPCPFYQQGRCLFAEKCNFLHTVKVKAPSEASQADMLPQTPLSPAVNIHFPRSVRSPPRDPRLSGLLLALKDVIGEDPDDHVEEETLSLMGLVSDALAVPEHAEDWTVVGSSVSMPTLPSDSEGCLDEGDTITAGIATRDTKVEDGQIIGAVEDIQEPEEDIGIRSASPLVSNNVGLLTEIEDAVDKPSIGAAGSIMDGPDSHSIPCDLPGIEDAVNQPSINTIESSPDGPDGSSIPCDLLSPVDLSHLHLKPFLRDDFDTSAREGDSIDSGYADHWKTPGPYALSPPRSPALSSTFDLLSSPFGSPSARLLSPRLSAFIPSTSHSPLGIPFPRYGSDPDDDFVPSELSLDSPRMLSSSGGSPELQDIQTARANQSLLVADEPVDIQAAHENQSFLVTNEPVDIFTSNPPSCGSGGSENSSPPADDEELSDASDELREDEPSSSTSVWDSEGQPTAVFLGMPPLSQDDVTNAIRRLSASPVHFLESAPVCFSPAEPDGVSSVVGSPSSEVSEMSPPPGADGDIRSPTAHLAYLTSPPPPAPANENDTLNSLYDVYSAFAAPGGVQARPDSGASGRTPAPSYDAHPAFIPPEVRGWPYSGAGGRLPTPPPRASEGQLSTPIALAPLRERVFTPPPSNRSRAGTVTPSSASSFASMPTSSFEFLPRNTSPFSIPIQSKHALGSQASLGSQSPVSETSDVPKKVPFGFRQSFALGGAKNSTLITNRVSRTTLPPLKSPTPAQPPALSQLPPSKPPTSPVTRGLKTLRLSTALNTRPNPPFSLPSPHANILSSNHHPGNIHRASISSASVSSGNSLSNNPLLSSSLIPEHTREMLPNLDETQTTLRSFTLRRLTSFLEPQSAPIPHQSPWTYDPTSDHHRPSSRLSEPQFLINSEDVDDNQIADINDYPIRRPLPPPHTAPVTRSASVSRPPMYAIATPKPTLMFAIASDDVEQVKNVLEMGEAGPNDAVGPQSALEFALTNDQLSHKMEIVKTLLAYGADPAVLRKSEIGLACRASTSNAPEEPRHEPKPAVMDEMDPATKYYVERADAVHTRQTSALIHRSFFRPLTRVRYELIGQDRALEQLFKVLSIHSRQFSVTPIVVLLCGPSGHGKSLLARKFGSLLDVPTHTVNMTTLKSTHDIWQSYSMSPYETPTTCTLAEFLINNEGKRCVVVLDEIEKIGDEKMLWSLLMPWELGRCSFEANSRHIDVRNVIWLCTSNVGHELVFEHRESREHPDGLMSREEYVELMGLLRPRVSKRLGASVLSRVTTVLPFVPFTNDEKKAICSEALYTVAGEAMRSISSTTMESMIKAAMASYCPEEGARSLYRAVSNQLVDTI